MEVEFPSHRFDCWTSEMNIIVDHFYSLVKFSQNFQKDQMSDTRTLACLNEKTSFHIRSSKNMHDSYLQ